MMGNLTKISKTTYRTLSQVNEELFPPYPTVQEAYDELKKALSKSSAPVGKEWKIQSLNLSYLDAQSDEEFFHHIQEVFPRAA